jgi:hypothetical protein
VEWITKFKTTNGSIIRTKANTDRLSGFSTAVNRFLLNAGYNDMLDGFLENFNAVSDAQIEIHGELNDIKLTRSFINPFKSWAVNNVISDMTGQGLNENLINPLRSELFIAVNQGSTLTDVITSISGQLTTTETRQGVLKRIALQASRDALGQYDGIVNEAVRKSYKLDALLYVGSLVKDSRAQCERWVDYDKNGKVGMLLFEDLEQEIAWAENNGTGMIPNTTPENFCQNRGGFNCRHICYPIRRPKEKEAEPEAPTQEITPEFVEAKNVKEAKVKTKEIFENAGIQVDKISFSSDLKLEDLNARNKQFNFLTTNYKLEGFSKPIQITNKSTTKSYGVVVTSLNNRTKTSYVSSANFGDKTDTKERIQTLKEEKELFSFKKLRNKSRVDEKNNKLATLTHEFAHFTTTTSKAAYGDKTANDFFKKLEVIRSDYNKELDKVADTDAFFDIFLGKYANSNLNEFLAEGFTEYTLSKSPSKYAIKIGKLFDKFYKK